jgi:hypothetical protein
MAEACREPGLLVDGRETQERTHLALEVAERRRLADPPAAEELLQRDEPLKPPAARDGPDLLPTRAILLRLMQPVLRFEVQP